MNNQDSREPRQGSLSEAAALSGTVPAVPSRDVVVPPSPTNHAPEDCGDLSSVWGRVAEQPAWDALTDWLDELIADAGTADERLARLARRLEI